MNKHTDANRSGKGYMRVHTWKTTYETIYVGVRVGAGGILNGYFVCYDEKAGRYMRTGRVPLSLYLNPPLWRLIYEELLAQEVELAMQPPANTDNQPA